QRLCNLASCPGIWPKVTCTCGGQSDNPLSPYYDAGWQAWAKGRPTPLLPGHVQHTLLVVPDVRGR
ncbi:MAG: hypothetical protein ACYCUI_16580, partial [Vulcanimicrobiaceae bacterium]